MAAYHRRVTRLFVIVMIVLLPLRGWAADVMAIQAAPGGSSTWVASDMPSDCPMLAATDAAAAADDALAPATAAADCCASCELCTPVAGPVGLGFDVVAPAPDARPLTADAEFASAAAAPAVKPPNS